VLLLTVLASLTGCAKTVYRTQLEIYCPQIKQYDEQFNQKLANEIDSLPPDFRAIEEAIGNYVYLRDRIRRCEAEKDRIDG
jgi:hypothetical protein